MSIIQIVDLYISFFILIVPQIRHSNCLLFQYFPYTQTQLINIHNFKH